MEDEEMEGEEKLASAPAASGQNGALSGVELNCLMRLTDDYLLMTTSKNNAMLFIEKMYNLT